MNAGARPGRGGTPVAAATLAWTLLGLLLAGWPDARPAVTPLLVPPRAEPLPIVLPDDAQPAERRAAEELAEHLTLAAGRPFEILDERAWNAARPAIWVGGTGFAGARSLACGDGVEEAWQVRSIGRHVVLCGGGRRGTLYAVYRFLEDQVGVRWWTPFERTVPSNAALALPALDERGRPAFVYRDLNGGVGPAAFYARSRLNGHFSGLDASWGGSERYGPPRQVHNFHHYVPPDEFLDSHPEYFSEVGGLRLADGAQLCLTAPGLAALVAERLLAYEESARAEAAARGDLAPRLYDVSQNDWGRYCQCAACSALYASEGSPAGAVIAFVNDVAARVAARRPGLLVDTLAYGWSAAPPAHARPRDDVVVRFAPLYDRDFAKPLDDPANAGIRAALDGWAARTRRLRVWDYAVTYGDAGDLPRPDIGWLAEDLRAYRARNVEGVFVQHDPPVTAHLSDLKRWVLAKLLEDPDRDPAQLVHEFTEGYYGAAGEPVRRYLDALERAARAHPALVVFDAGAEAFAWLDADFVLEAQAIFDEAEARVAADRTGLRRVRHARFGLDNATLERWDWLDGAREGIDRDALLERWRATQLEQIDLRLAGAARDEARNSVELEAADW